MNTLSVTLLGAAMLFSFPLAAQQVEVEAIATFDYYGHEIEILDDETWQFTETGVTLAELSSSDVPCDSLENERVVVCYPEDGWTRETVFLDENYKEYSYVHTDGLTLTIGYDERYGHSGELEYWSEYTESGLAEWITQKVYTAFTGGELGKERVVIIDDIVFFDQLTHLDDTIYTYTAELMSKDASIWIDLSGYNLDPNAGGGLATLAAGAVDDIHGRIKIDNQTLTDVLLAQEAAE